MFYFVACDAFEITGNNTKSMLRVIWKLEDPNIKRIKVMFYFVRREIEKSMTKFFLFFQVFLANTGSRYRYILTIGSVNIHKASMIYWYNSGFRTRSVLLLFWKMLHGLCSGCRSIPYIHTLTQRGQSPSDLQSNSGPQFRLSHVDGHLKIFGD